MIRSILPTTLSLTPLCTPLRSFSILRWFSATVFSALSNLSPVRDKNRGGWRHCMCACRHCKFGWRHWNVDACKWRCDLHENNPQRTEYKKHEFFVIFAEIIFILQSERDVTFVDVKSETDPDEVQRISCATLDKRFIVTWTDANKHKRTDLAARFVSLKSRFVFEPGFVSCALSAAPSGGRSLGRAAGSEARSGHGSAPGCPGCDAVQRNKRWRRHHRIAMRGSPTLVRAPPRQLAVRQQRFT